MNIEEIHLKWFKSIADIRLNDATHFSVFAGENGSGKSRLAKRMVKNFCFEASQPALYSECSSAKLLINGLQELTRKQVNGE